MKKLLFFFLALPSVAFGSGIYNPGSGTGGGSGSSSLQVTKSGVEVTSPTASLNFFSNDFLVGAIGTTSQILLNPATTNYIHNQATLQTGTTAYPDFMYVGSSATVGTGGLSDLGVLDVNRPDLTGFSGQGRLYFDPASPPELKIFNNNFIATSDRLSFYDRVPSLASYIDGTLSTTPSFSFYVSSGTCGASRCAPLPRAAYGGTSESYSTLNNNLGTEVMRVNFSSISISGVSGLNVSYGAIVGSMTVSNLTSGQCVQAGTGGLLTVSGSACGTGGGGVTVYPASATASFPFGFSSSTETSTAFIATLTSVTVTGSGGLTVVKALNVSSTTILPGATFYTGGPILLGNPGFAVYISSALFLQDATFYSSGDMAMHGANLFQPSASTGPYVQYTNNASTTVFIVNSLGLNVGLNQTRCPLDITFPNGQLMDQVQVTGERDWYVGQFQTVPLMTAQGYGTPFGPFYEMLTASGTHIFMGQTSSTDSVQWINSSRQMSGYVDSGGGLHWNGTAAFPTAGNFFNASVSAGQFYRASTAGTAQLVSYNLLGGPNTFTSSQTVTGGGGILNTYGIQSSTGVFTTGLFVSTGAINAESGFLTIANNNNLPSYASSIGASVSAGMVIKSSVTTTQSQIGIAPLFVDNWISLTGSPVVSIGAFQGVTGIQGSDAATYTALGTVSNAQGGTLLGQYSGIGSLPILSGVVTTAVRKGTGTVTEMNAGLFDIQQSSGGTVARTAGVHVKQLTGIAGGITTDAMGVWISTQTPAAGTITNSYAWKSDGIKDHIVFAGHLISSGTTPTASSCGSSPVLTGTDTGFSVTPGATATGCTVTFKVPFVNTPVCSIGNRTMSLVNALAYTPAATNIAWTQTGAAGATYDVICIGNQQ